MKHIPRKRFGQNFLNNQHIISDIVHAIHPQTTDNIIEIGPGLGAITQPLLTHLDHLTVIEIDRDLQSYLQQLPLGKNKLQIIAADALTIDYGQLGKELRIVGNLPYNISTPLLIHLLNFTASISDMHFMLQKEVVQRMAAAPGSKAYGRLSVMMQYHCEVEHLFDVPPTAFEPMPKVDSAIVRLTPYHHKPFVDIGRKELEQLVAKAFAMRRKTLANNLKGVVNMEQLAALEIDGLWRPEQISVAQYAQLAKYVVSK